MSPATTPSFRQVIRTLSLLILTLVIFNTFINPVDARADAGALKPGAPNPPETMTLESSVLGETRHVYIQLPEGYAFSTKHYPVLVVLDGEWLFELARANVRFFSEYDAMDVALPRMIVVGIENTDRDRDYVPTKDPSDDPDFPTAGEADRFVEFLSTEVLPVVDREYRTVGSRAVVGWSFSGLFAMYSAYTAPDLFDAYLCIGPAIWWDDEMVVKAFQDVSFDRTKRMVITLGSGEQGGLVHTASTNFLKQTEEHPVAGLTVSHLEFEGVGHSWGMPSAMDRGMRELFSGFIAPDSVCGNSQEAIDAYYRELSERWHFRVLPPPPVMQGLALRQWYDDDKAGGLATIERLIEYDPNDAKAHFYRGAFLARQGQKEQALTSYKEALATELRRSVPIGINVLHYQGYVERTEKELEEESGQ